MIEGVNVKEHTLNLINALANLSPSRNIISQFALLLPNDLATIEHSYPETSTAETRELLERCLGVEFGDTVKRSDAGFATSIYTHIHKLFDWLDDKEVRSSLTKFMGTLVSSMHNPYAEWAKLVLKKLSSRPDGDKILVVLKMLLEHDSFIVDRRGYSRGAYQPDWQPFLDEAKEMLNMNPAEFEEVKRLTIRTGTPEGTEYIDTERSAYSMTNIYLEHSDYHLDLILSIKTYSGTGYNQRYDHFYELRHKNTMKALLREEFI